MKSKWYLFRVEQLQVKIISKAFPTKSKAEKARNKFSERERKAIGVGHIKS
jgi:hypothetical protein